MPVYPHWRNNKESRSIIKNLKLLEQVALEDGLFYKDGLSVIDARGEDVQVRLASQDADETQKAGTGIYGQFIVESLPLNPCTIRYIPRFTEDDEDTSYIKKSFDAVSSSTQPVLSRNIDDEIAENVLPDLDAILSFGNFTNTGRMVTALDKLTATLSKYYFDIDELPLAIEATYLNSKQGSRDALDAMRELELAEINGSEITSTSLRILSLPPRGELYGNYIFIAYRDESFVYKDENVSIVKGDICIINNGDLTTLLYGTDFKYKMLAVRNSLNMLSNYADSIQESLPTSSKDISDAVVEYTDSISGYYSNSLYVVSDIDGSEDLQVYNGTTIGTVSKTFTYNDTVYSKDDVILIIGGITINIGITENNSVALMEMKLALIQRKESLSEKLAPLLLLDTLLDLGPESSIPNRAAGDVAINGSELTIAGVSMNDVIAESAARDGIEALSPIDYMNAEEADALIETIDEVTTDLAETSFDIDATDLILDDMDIGSYIILPLCTTSESGYFYGEEPIVIDDYSLYIKDVVRVELGSLNITRIKIISGIIYLLTTDGLHRVNISEGTITPLTEYTLYHSAINVLSIMGKLSVVSYVNGSSIIDSGDTTSVVEGRVLEVIPSSEVVIVDLNDSIYLFNLRNDSRILTDTTGDIAYRTGNSVIIVKDGGIKSIISKDGLISYSYGESGLLDWGKFNVYDGQVDATVTIDGYGTDFKVVVL